MNQIPRIAIIILNWNNIGDTVRTLHAISDWTTVDPDIIIVNNNPDEYKLIQSFPYSPKIIFLQSSTNRGFSGGNNLAFEYCTNHPVDFFLLLNSDATVDEKTVRELLITIGHHPDVAAIGPLIQEGDQIYAGGRNISRYVATRIPYNPKGTLLREVEYVQGTVLLIRKKSLLKAGLFNERYFFSGEVADLCHRFFQQGERCIVHTGLMATHHCEDSLSLRSDLHRYYSIRNRFLYIRTFERIQAPIRVLFWIIWALSTACIALINKNHPACRATLLALIDGILGRFGDRNEYFIH